MRNWSLSSTRWFCGKKHKIGKRNLYLTENVKVLLDDFGDPDVERMVWIAKIIQKNFNIIRADPTTHATFPSPPLLSYRKYTNLRNTLVHSQLTPKQDNPSMDPCHRPRCKMSKFTYSTNIIHGPKGEISITCAKCEISITCAKCDAVYIGETKRMIAECFRQHLYDIDITDTTKPVPKHSTTNNHT